MSEVGNVDADEESYECGNCGAIYNTILPRHWLPVSCYECNERYPWIRVSDD